MESNKILGLFPTTRWPAADSEHERSVRDRLAAVIVGGLTPQPHETALTSMLSAIDVAPKVVGDGDRKLVKRRAKEIVEQEWAGEAVKKPVEAVNAAATAAITAAATAGAASGGS